MDFLSILYTIFIQPLQLVFELIYNTANYYTDHPGLSIIVLSLTMNFLVLPLYKRADEMQEQQRDIEMKLKKGVDHINKSFSGDERMMILQTYYRQNHYKPTDALNGSISLLLEIPFFIAAYQFLSHLSILEGVSLGPIMDLSQPDALIVIGGMSFHLLPILMTVVNVVSSAIYLKGFPLKTKIQLYAMALFFLVFLYESPSGLVFYWTLNNVFSLCKNVFYKLKNPAKALYYLFSSIGIVLLLSGLFFYPTKYIDKRIFLSLLGVLLQIPLLISIIKNKVNIKNKKECLPLYKNVILSGLLIAVILGVFIPSSIISASTQEFISSIYFHNPLFYLVSTFSISIGFFVLWIGVFYWISNHKVKVLFENSMFVFSFMIIMNYMFFGTELGNLLPNLQYENGLFFSNIETILNIIANIVLIILLVFAFKRLRKHITNLILITLCAFMCLSGMNVYSIYNDVNEYQESMQKIPRNLPQINLSKEGKNVIVLMLDRGLNHVVPYLFNEKPELKKQFEGFTYYNNVISYGGYTNFATPSLFGGYEYTPIKLNERDNELLVDKHNEALKVLPHLYDENDYEVTVFDPPYANYKWFSDVSIYDEYPNIKAFITEGTFSDNTTEKLNVNKNHRNFFLFSVMKGVPLSLQNFIYNSGNYNSLNVEDSEGIVYSTQTIHSLTTSKGIFNNFMRSYNVLLNLKNITNIKDDNSHNFLMMSNNATHEPMMLQTPHYVPSMNVDNTDYFNQIKDKYTIDGNTLKMEETTHITHYHINMATFLQLGDWFDYMRENDVYDNTRIILASDHGRYLEQLDELKLGDNFLDNAELYYPLLMVKDFNSKEYSVSEEFMTNADVPTLALKDIIDNPINPFTGNPINNDVKYTEEHYIIRDTYNDVNKNNGNTYAPSQWAIVKDNIWDKNNWTLIDEKTTDPRK